jgi:uncharacterized SAM-binding protein YcdF (DUF218 family)
VTLDERLHNYLDIASKPSPCDAIFVLAGRQERKVHGVDLWRVGYAPELILSVGRFEWRRFYDLGLPRDGGLRKLVDAVPPVERHFFVREWKDRAEILAVAKGKYGTLTEALAAARLLREGEYRSLMVVSSAYHLRRVALAFGRAFRGSGTRLVFVPVPNEPPESRSELLRELRKYLLYRLLLFYPGAVSRRR